MCTHKLLNAEDIAGLWPEGSEQVLRDGILLTWETEKENWIPRKVDSLWKMEKSGSRTCPNSS